MAKAQTFAEQCSSQNTIYHYLKAETQFYAATFPEAIQQLQPNGLPEETSDR